MRHVLQHEDRSAVTTMPQKGVVDGVEVESCVTVVTQTAAGLRPDTHLHVLR